MSQTSAAQGNSPAESFEPAPFLGSFANVAARRGGSKAPYLKEDSFGIGESVLVGAVDRYYLRGTCYDIVALAAKNLFSSMAIDLRFIIIQ